MRELPELWVGRQRVQWACALMEMLGGRDLQLVPLLMSGLRSVESSPTLSEHTQAVKTARVIVPHYTTRRAVLHAINEYGEHLREKATSGSYTIKPGTLEFERTSPLIDADVEDARETLMAPLKHRLTKMVIADPRLPMSVRFEDPEIPPVPITPIDSEVPSPPQHDTENVPAGSIEVPIAGLFALARELDKLAEQHPDWRQEHWEKRLGLSRLMRPNRGRLRETDILSLSGLKHLLGLPGSGKTTLLILLSIYLARRDYRVALFFTSIEVARQYLETFERYGEKTGMLVGQSPMTRSGHAIRIAELIAAQGDNGFARTVTGADLFANNCMLPAFSPEGRAGWPFGYAPCTTIFQKTDGARKPQLHLCPLWSVCGRNKAPRELSWANIWVGHVISMDTEVPPHAIKERLRYFELISNTFDVVVFDECDMTQKLLDEYGSAALNLSGTEGSVHQIAEDQVLARLAGEENHRLFEAKNVAYARHLAEFGTHNHILVHTLQIVDRVVGDRYENQLLTTSRIITELLDEHQDARSRDWQSAGERLGRRAKHEALWEFWDSSIFAAFFDRSGTGADSWDKAGACAHVLGLAEKELAALRVRLISLFRDYLAEDSAAVRDERLIAVEKVFLGVAFRQSEPPKDASDVLRLLVAISFMILAYKRIVVGARELVAQGFFARDPFAGGSGLSVGASRELQRVVPVNSLGALSGVRYRFEQTSPGRRDARSVKLSYLIVKGAPRMLMHRFHELHGNDGPGPNVLLTSATSYLSKSPSYHVDHGPHYLLSPKVEEHKPENSRYVFRPVYENGKALRFSGAGRLASRNLERMLEKLVEGDEQSEIYRQINTWDVLDGVRRKAAIVVNSYEQVRQLKKYLDRQHPWVGRRTVGVVRDLLRDERHEDYITPAQVENIGDDQGVDILIFPMLAIGRGVNIVFTRGPRTRWLKAAIGSMYFLTRPHPSTDDLGLLLGLAAKATQEFNEQDFPPDDDLADIAEAWRMARSRVFRDSARLLQEPLMASRLSDRLFESFTADQMVPILQTIGRGMRGGSPVQVFFVDAAWAPHSAKDEDDEEVDRPKESMLVMMRAILEECMRAPDPVIRETYKELYEAFLEPLRNTQNVNFPASFDDYIVEDEPDTPIGPAAYLLEDHEDLNEPIVPGDDLDTHGFVEEDHV